MDNEILSWAATSFASGALSSAGGMAFNNLVAYIGMEQPDQKILNQLGEISNQLKELARGIGEVNQRVIDLSKQLAISTLEIEQILQEANLGRALSSIRTHVGTPASTPFQSKKGKIKAGTEVTSLAEILNRIIGREQLTAGMVKSFFKEVLRAWDIPTAVNEIHRGLLGSDLNGGILSISARLSIAKMGSGDWDPNLFQHYEALESRFLSLLSIQMEGVFLVVAAKNYGSDSADVSPESARYLWQEYVPRVLSPQLDRFLWCAEKLALSQGQWRSPWPVPGSSTYTDQQGRVRLKGGLGAPPELGKILLRSQMVAQRLREAFRDMRDYKPKYPERRPVKELTDLVRTQGIYVHRLCRESEINRDQGPELVPWPGHESRGRALPATGALIPQWDGSKDGFAKLKSPEGSIIRVVRYFWPEVDSPGKDPERSFASMLPRAKPYSETELSTTVGLDWKGVGKVTHYLDLKSLCAVPQFESGPSSGWIVSPITFEKGHNSGKLTSHYLDTPLMGPVLSRPDERAQFTLAGTKVSRRGNAMRVECRLEARIFRYEGLQPRPLMLHLWLLAENYRKGYLDKFLHMGGRVMVNLKKPSGEQQIYDSETVPGFTLWDWDGAGGEARTLDEPRLSIPLKVGDTGKPEQYSLVVNLQVGHEGLGGDIMASISGLIRECSLSWVAAAPAAAARRATASKARKSKAAERKAVKPGAKVRRKAVKQRLTRAKRQKAKR